MFTKEAVNRLTQELSNLGGSAIKRLRNSGLLRSKARMVSGLERGTANINNRLGISTQQAPMSKVIGFGGYGFDPSTNTALHMNAKNPLARLLTPLHKTLEFPSNTSMRAAVANRHEAYEALAGASGDVGTGLVMRAVGAPKKVEEFMVRHPGNNLLATFDDGLYTRTGMHNSLSVLGKESNDIKRLRDLGYLSDKEPVVRYRGKSGEQSVLKNITGKQYGKDTFTRRDIAKLRAPSTDTIMVQGPVGPVIIPTHKAP